MPVLSNPRHETFCQEKAKGRTNMEAYLTAGYKGKNRNSADVTAKRLADRPEVKARLAELMEGAAEKAEVTIAEVLRELKRIGFSDIRNTVKWQTNVLGMVEDPETGQMRPALTNEVAVVNSADMSVDHAAAIAEISQSDKGGIKVKHHNKVQALELIGRHLKMFTDKHEHTGKDGGPIETKDVSDIEAARRVAFLLAKGLNEA